ncbi:hypothetical protein LWC34_05280 [Kibdelosporangium philippinense]|uniref:Secreted protein n=1 Tax=Kibdelosporangium philippinense TaxID=211113 RepID=A0ABS8Z4B8_9PSEU|nr:hypothetical protein [Kibdelosporangium philippinense]MCE7002242.1 hypothetical protein [Kibdelosporangium philippinense]
MQHLVKRAAVLGTVAAAAFVMTPLAAFAGGNSNTCSGSSCSVEASGFPGGTLSVDADVHGSGGAEWVVFSGDRLACRTNFAAGDPPRSWVCNNVPAGHLQASVSGPAGPSNIGLRW